MMQRSKSVQNGPLISDALIRDTLRRELHRSLNVERDFSRGQLSTESGVNVYTIDSILSRDPAKHRRIAMEDALSIAQVLGPRAVNALTGLILYGAYQLDETGEPDAASILADGMGHMATLARIFADGRIDSHEADDAIAAADGLIDTVTPISSRKVGR